MKYRIVEKWDWLFYLQKKSSRISRWKNIQRDAVGFDLEIIKTTAVYDSLDDAKEAMEIFVENDQKEINKDKFPDVHNMVGYSIEKLVSKCLEENSTDNLTVIMICLKNYDKLKIYQTPVPQTENIEQVKTKKLNITANLRQKSQSKKPLSMLLTKMIHNNSQNIKKVINLKNNDNKDTNNRERIRKTENK